MSPARRYITLEEHAAMTLQLRQDRQALQRKLERRDARIQKLYKQLRREINRR